MRTCLTILLISLSWSAYSYRTLTELLRPISVTLRSDGAIILNAPWAPGVTTLSRPITFSGPNADEGWGRYDLLMSIVNPETGAQAQHPWHVLGLNGTTSAPSFKPSRNNYLDTSVFSQALVQSILPKGYGNVCVLFRERSGAYVDLSINSCVRVEQPNPTCAITTPGSIHIGTVYDHSGSVRGSGEVDVKFSCDHPVSATLERKVLTCPADGTWKTTAPSADCDAPITLTSPDWPWGTSKTGDSHNIRVKAEYSNDSAVPGLHKWVYLITAQYD